jgi:hypothetical protein
MTERTATMTATEARAHLARLKLTHGEFTRLMGVADRTARRWLAIEGDPLPIPRAVEIALTELTPAKVRKWMSE